MKTLPNIPSDRTDYVYSYHFLTRQTKSRAWTRVASARCAGDCCMAMAEDYFTANGYTVNDYSLQRLVDGDQWNKIQVSQHLQNKKP